MKYRLMDLLACPVDKAWPLKLEIEEKEEESEKIPIPIENSLTNVVCSYYCDYKKYYLVNIKEDSTEEVKEIDEIEKNVSKRDCEKCFQIEITKGKLYCSENDEHVYDIKEGIPVMLTPNQIKELYGDKK
ncbi:MAG: Trm112 family protein [Candidatus Thorarchaeota archaeon]